MTNRQEVKVQTRDPGEGNPTPTRQGRRSGAPGPCRRRSPGGPARGGLVEVIGVRPFRAKAKRRKASASGRARRRGRRPVFAGDAGVGATGWPRSLLDLTRGGLLGPAQAVGRTTREGKPMTQQIKDQRAVSGKRPKGRLNPEGDLSGEGKRWRRRWRHNANDTGIQDRAAPRGEHGGRSSRPIDCYRDACRRRIPASSPSVPVAATDVLTRAAMCLTRSTPWPSSLMPPTGRKPAGDGGNNPSS
jgi:hypothetical protein